MEEQDDDALPVNHREIENWIVEARRGSSEALGHLIEACRNYLLHFANRELPSELWPKIAPSDLVQETLLEAHRDFPQFEGRQRAELLAWLRRILINNLNNATRKFRDAAKRRLDREASLEALNDEGQLPALASSEPPPGWALERQEQLDQLETLIDRLPADYRQVLLAYHKEHRSFHDIAEQMGRSEAAVRKLWARAIERLQTEFDAEHERESDRPR